MTLTFNKQSHTYTLGDKKLTSVSQWIKQFTPPFDAEKISQAVAKKQGVDQQEILDKWEKKKNISLHLGNWVHESIEYYLTEDSEWTNPAVEAFKKHQTKNKYLSEKVVHDDEVAGTIDLIEVIGDKKVKIHDFKTNEDLHKGYGKMLEPFQNMPNCPLSKYTLQLTKYKELLEKMKGVEVVELNIWHYKDGEFNIINIRPIDLCRKKEEQQHSQKQNH